MPHPSIHHTLNIHTNTHRANPLAKAGPGHKVKIRMERGRLVCDGETFERGEQVIVHSVLSGEDFYGSVQSIGSLEVNKESATALLATTVTLPSFCCCLCLDSRPLHTHTQIGVRLADGTRSRVPVTMLQQGRCTIKKAPM